MSKIRDAFNVILWLASVYLTFSVMMHPAALSVLYDVVWWSNLVYYEHVSVPLSYITGGLYDILHWALWGYDKYVCLYINGMYKVSRALTGAPATEHACWKFRWSETAREPVSVFDWPALL